MLELLKNDLIDVISETTMGLINDGIWGMFHVKDEEGTYFIQTDSNIIYLIKNKSYVIEILVSFASKTTFGFLYSSFSCCY